MDNRSSSYVPADGWAGFRNHFLTDAKAGFTVFLLALPLSLGIAKASDFPAIMGVVTAIIGGVVVSFFAGSRLTIKGAAAGLIVIVAEAVEGFGGGEHGWRLALGAMVVAGVVQVLFGVLKLGRMTGFFPIAAVHGMLAAIGIIIIAKQIPVLLAIDPSMTGGKTPFELFAQVPYDLSHLDPKATLVGVVSLWVMLDWGSVGNKWLRMIPAPLVVLLIAIPFGLLMDFQHTEPAYTLVKVGDFMGSMGIHVSMAGVVHPWMFAKVVIMLAIVGTLESLLTVKAIDELDNYERTSDANKDLIAIGVGNTLAALVGGLPMISEVARSSANVNSGAKTRWANWFHGVFLLVFVLAFVQVIELIPNAALAAMLITVGIKLASPKEFVHILHIGKEQLAVFLVTIFFTLFEDLLVGIAAGILLELLICIFNGASIRHLFKPAITISATENGYTVKLQSAAVFSNFLGIQTALATLPQGESVVLDFNNAPLIDHSAMKGLLAFQKNYIAKGGNLTILGMEHYHAFSAHPLAARKKMLMWQKI